MSVVKDLVRALQEKHPVLKKVGNIRASTCGDISVVVRVDGDKMTYDINIPAIKIMAEEDMKKEEPKDK